MRRAKHSRRRRLWELDNTPDCDDDDELNIPLFRAPAAGKSG